MKITCWLIFFSQNGRYFATTFFIFQSLFQIHNFQLCNMEIFITRCLLMKLY